MSIELSPEIERYVKEQVESGRFASATEVLEAGVARLRDDENWGVDFDDEDEIKALEEAERQIAAGETLDFKQVAAELRREFLGE